MRTMVGADDVVESLPRISVKDGNGSWTDITSRLYSVSYDDNIDVDSGSVTLQFRNQPDLYVQGATNYNLDPLDTNSLYFINSEPLLGRKHELKLEITKDSGAHYYEIFRGRVGSGSVSVSTSVKRDDTVSVTPADISIPYKELHYYDGLVYKTASATSIMTQIFVDNGFNQTVTVIDEPDYYVEEIETGQTSVWEAQKSVITPTGYVYRIKWNSDAFKPCVYDADRTKTVPDYVFSGTFNYRKIDLSEADSRQKIIVIYRNRNSGNVEYAQAEDETARNKYGIPDGYGNKISNTMWYSAQGSGSYYSLIDSAPEAEDLANYILHDLKDPIPDIEIRIPRVVPSIELHDLLSFIGEDYSVNVGVVGISFDWSTDNKIGTTTISGTTDRVIGAYNLWLSHDAHSPDVQQELQVAFLAGDGKAPARPATPECLSHWGVDSSTGSDVPITICTVTKNREWDLAGYLWSFQIEGEAETESRITQDPRLVIKGLPVGKTARVWVQAFDWSAKGMS